MENIQLLQPNATLPMFATAFRKDFVTANLAPEKLKEQWEIFKNDPITYEYVGENPSSESSEFETVVTSSPYLDALKVAIVNGSVNIGGGTGASSVLPRLFTSELDGRISKVLATQLNGRLPNVLESVTFKSAKLVENPRFNDEMPINKNGNFELISEFSFTAKKSDGSTFDFTLSPNATVGQKFASRYPENTVIEIKNTSVFHVFYYKITDAALTFRINPK